MSKLKKHIDDNNSFLLIPTIVRNEVIKNIKQKVNHSINAITKQKRQFEWLSEYESLFDASSFEQYKEKVLDNIIDSLEDNFLYLGEEIKCDNVCAEDIFSDYFSELPPFRDYKEEFKDAFIAYSILNWAKFHQVNKISIISGNKNDWGEICEREIFKKKFLYYQSIDEYLEKHLQIEDAILGKIKKSMINQLPTALLTTLSNFWFELPCELWSEKEQDPILIQNSIDIAINEGSIYIIDGDTHGSFFEITFNGQFTYKVEINTPDPDSSVRSQNGDICYRHRVKGILSAEHKFSANATILKKKDYFFIKEIIPQSNGSITVPWTEDEDEYEDYIDKFIEFIPTSK